MKEYVLKYGCNPEQKQARVFMREGQLPFAILNGTAGYINLLDALNSWQLVKELKEATGLAAAASFKHVSPAGVAVEGPLDEVLRKIYFVEQEEISPLATAYIRARGVDRMSSYGDFVALSEECDACTAHYLAKEVSDGIIAPGYSKEALEILKKKRRGNYLIIKIDSHYMPHEIETKEVFGVTFEQSRNSIKLTQDLFKKVVTNNEIIPQEAQRDLLLGMITLKYTQSNSVCYVKGGQAIGIGAGQQSRIHCTRLAGNKADTWFLRQSSEVMNLPFKEGLARSDRDNAIDLYLSEDYEELLTDGIWQTIFKEKPKTFTKEAQKVWLQQLEEVSLVSDAFFPFGDNIERAKRSGVKYIAQPGGSLRDEHVIEMCNKYHIAMAFTDVRLFQH